MKIELSTFKTAKTIKEYRIEFRSFLVIIPIGSIVSNHTACGNDDNYRFWTDYHQNIKELTGFNNSMLHHDIKHYGINIPLEYCEAYKI